MVCKICKIREIRTTDGRCQECIGKVETFIYPSIYSEASECEGKITKEDEKKFYRKVLKSNC